jgi:hypothetical protein
MNKKKSFKNLAIYIRFLYFIRSQSVFSESFKSSKLKLLKLH